MDGNPLTVKWHRDKSRNVRLPEDLCDLKSECDVILFSHIIEHFSYSELVIFLNRYLALLKPAGLVILLTPTPHKGFYDDFDHVKPYSPAAIRQIFCRSTPQVQDFGFKSEFEELYLWLKRDPLWHSHRKGKWTHFFGIASVLLYVLSLSFIGRLTGYGMALKNKKESR